MTDLLKVNNNQIETIFKSVKKDDIDRMEKVINNLDTSEIKSLNKITQKIIQNFLNDTQLDQLRQEILGPLYLKCKAGDGVSDNELKKHYDQLQKEGCLKTCESYKDLANLCLMKNFKVDPEKTCLKGCNNTEKKIKKFNFKMIDFVFIILMLFIFGNNYIQNNFNLQQEYNANKIYNLQHLQKDFFNLQQQYNSNKIYNLQHLQQGFFNLQEYPEHRDIIKKIEKLPIIDVNKKNFLGQGISSNAYQYCIDDNCNYVSLVKKRPIMIQCTKNKIGCEDYKKLDQDKELINYMAKNDITIPVIDYGKNKDNKYVIILPKLDITLSDYLSNYKVLKSTLDEIIKKLESLITKMHSLRIIHNDLHRHYKNIMFNFKKGTHEVDIDSIKIIDFSLAEDYRNKEFDYNSNLGKQDDYSVINKLKQLLIDDGDNSLYIDYL